jgi:hypothetical protein
MRPFSLRQILESMVWLSLAFAAYRLFDWADRSAYSDEYYREWAVVISWTTWIVAGAAIGNAVAALFRRRIVWTILGICWTYFFLLAMYGVGVIPHPFRLF